MKMIDKKLITIIVALSFCLNWTECTYYYDKNHGMKQI